MSSQKCQTLEDGLIFSLAKRLVTWQIPTNNKFQLHNCWRCSKALFNSPQNLKTVQDSPSHQNLRHMHEALNINENKN